MGVGIAIMFALATMMIGVGVIANSSLGSSDDIAQSWKERNDRHNEQALTALSLTTVNQSSPYVDFVIENSGQLAAGRFSDWDVFVQYYETDHAYHLTWLPYTTANPPEDNRWTVTGVYVDALTTSAEVFEPNLLNPGEEAVLRVRLNPFPKAPPANLAIISTDNAATIEARF